MMLSKLSDFQKTLFGVCVLALVAYGGWWVIQAYPAGSADHTREIEQKTLAFGEALRHVSLSAEQTVRAQGLKQAYGSFVTPELLSQWTAHPENAIGRQTSSPWPERIELGTVTQNADGSYTALGSVVEVTSESKDAAAIYPVSLTYENREGTWLIRESTKGTYTALPERRTLEGTFVCLPHKNQDGPQTMECAFGLKADNGAYYALDLTILNQLGDYPNLESERRVQVEGTFVPVENLSTEHWARYAVEGIVRVTSLTVL